MRTAPATRVRYSRKVDPARSAARAERAYRRMRSVSTSKKPARSVARSWITCPTLLSSAISIIGLYRGLVIVPRKFGSFAQARQHAITGRAIGRELGKSRLRLLVLAGLGKRHRLLKRGAGFGRLLGLPPFVAAPRAHPDDSEEACGDDVVAVTLPQPFKLFATDLLIDFLENIGHRYCPSASHVQRNHLHSVITGWKRPSEAGPTN